MAICANCTGEALYTYSISGDYGINYCQYHLPRFLFSARDAGLLQLVEVPSEKPAAKAKKAVAEEDASN